jgi:hypothetical protein
MKKKSAQFVPLAKYYLTDRIKNDDMESACDMNGDKINAYKVSVGKSKDN